MTREPCSPGWTVLDLCEASYREPDGVFYDSVNFLDVVPLSRWKLVVACVNAKIGNLSSSIFDTIVAAYEPLLTTPLPLTVDVRHIFNLCKDRGLPVVAQVDEDTEKCIVVATCHDPWTAWFEAAFCDCDNDTRNAVMDELSPTIRQLLAELRRQTSHNPARPIT